MTLFPPQQVLEEQNGLVEGISHHCAEAKLSNATSTEPETGRKPSLRSS